MPEFGLDPEAIAAAVDSALVEDVGEGDVTTRATVPSDARLDARMMARQDLVVAGMPVMREVFRRLAPEAVISIGTDDGEHVAAGVEMARITGKAEAILTAERSALNTVQFLSGIATLTRQYADALAGTGAVLLDTRKTIPGLRVLSKYAVRCGGGTNHRMRLDDGILIKDNHIAVAGGIAKAVTRARAANPRNLAVQAECDTLEQVRDALAAGADRLLLDNMAPQVLRQAVEIVGGRIPLEASGGISLETIRSIAETGVDFVSVGAITQRAPAVDIGLDFVWA